MIDCEACSGGLPMEERLSSTVPLTLHRAAGTFRARAGGKEAVRRTEGARGIRGGEWVLVELQILEAKRIVRRRERALLPFEIPVKLLSIVKRTTTFSPHDVAAGKDAAVE